MRKIILLSVILCACSKEKNNLGPRYEQFVGVWKSVSSSENEEIHVHENGVIKIYYEFERVKKLKVTQWYNVDTVTIDGNEWSGAGFRGKYKTSIVLRRNLPGDTLISSSSAADINNGVLTVPENRRRFIKVY